MEKKEKKKIFFFKETEICHDCASASAISEFFALALTSLKKSCALARSPPDERALGAPLKWAALTKALWLYLLVNVSVTLGMKNEIWSISFDKHVPPTSVITMISSKVFCNSNSWSTVNFTIWNRAFESSSSRTRYGLWLQNAYLKITRSNKFIKKAIID